MVDPDWVLNAIPNLTKKSNEFMVITTNTGPYNTRVYDSFSTLENKKWALITEPYKPQNPYRLAIHPTRPQEDFSQPWASRRNKLLGMCSGGESGGTFEERVPSTSQLLLLVIPTKQSGDRKRKYQETSDPANEMDLEIPLVIGFMAVDQLHPNKLVILCAPQPLHIPNGSLIGIDVMLLSLFEAINDTVRMSLEAVNKELLVRYYLNRGWRLEDPRYQEWLDLIEEYKALEFPKFQQFHLSDGEIGGLISMSKPSPLKSKQGDAEKTRLELLGMVRDAQQRAGSIEHVLGLLKDLKM